MNKRLYTTEEVMKICKISDGFIKEKLRKKKIIPYVKSSGKRERNLYSEQNLFEFILLKEVVKIKSSKLFPYFNRCKYEDMAIVSVDNFIVVSVDMKALRKVLVQQL